MVMIFGDEVETVIFSAPTMLVVLFDSPLMAGEPPEGPPPAVKLPTPHPVQVPLTTRFLSVVVDPVIVTVPGNVAVMPDLPIVIAVEDEVPIVMVPEPSTTTPESPEIPVPLKVSDAKAIETPPTMAAMMI